MGFGKANILELVHGAVIPTLRFFASTGGGREQKRTVYDSSMPAVGFRKTHRAFVVGVVLAMFCLLASTGLSYRVSNPTYGQL